MRSQSYILVLLMTLGAAAVAADRPVGGDRLVLKDPAGKPDSRSVKFKAGKDPVVDPASGADPRVGGATLEVVGANAGDGNTDPVQLPASRWVGLGRPEGSKGYRFKDQQRPGGIKTVTLKTGKSGGTLVISGGGSDWTYAITQPQGTIDLRLTVGGDVYCARFTTFDDNEPGKVKAKLAPAPSSCSVPPGQVCGNRVMEGAEQCDDGNATSGDGCSATCQREGAVCGNHAIEGAEECDDGNTTSGDGCSATCQLESTSDLCAGVPTVPGTGLDSVRVASGLTRPVYVTAPPRDVNRLFIVEQDGRVRIVKNNVLLATPFLDIAGSVSSVADNSSWSERGLLGMAFAPNYESSGVFYMSYTNNSGNLEVRRYTVSGNPDVANSAAAPVIAVSHPTYANHNGGHVAFGPDGYLYVGLGDGGGDQDGNAQNRNTLLGKMLRIDVNASTYTIPPSNPFVGVAGLDEIWAYGLRNPWRWSFDRGTGNLYIADVGQGAWEEVNFQPASSDGGENYGWNIYEANACYDGPCPTPGVTFPVLEYSHSQGCSITGGYVYRGCRMPDLRGTYFYSDICTPFIRTFKGVSGSVAQNKADRTADLAPGGGLSIGGVSSFGEDARGELYIVDYGDGSSGQGEVYRIVPGS